MGVTGEDLCHRRSLSSQGFGPSNPDESDFEPG